MGGIGEVEVMTPERLSHQLRNDPQGFLERFGLFVVDEAHSVGDTRRGWTLESAISYLHHATRETHHRLVLISATIGNRAHFVQWLGAGDEEDEVLEFHVDWRGPRRVHCIWTTEARWDDAITEVTPQGRRRRPRQRIPVYGKLSIRPTATGAVRHLATIEPVGELVRSQQDAGGWRRVGSESTPLYRMLVPLIRSLATPVLVVEATRLQTVRMAQAIADNIVGETADVGAIVDLVTSKLGDTHPLARVLQKGVAYHHGSLPHEVRTALEEALKDGVIQYLVATTTLTEGVNLPVRAVVVASQGIRSGEQFNEFITGSKLINAIGRAGRAARETEGVVVLARPAGFNVNDFDRFSIDDDRLRVTSELATEAALAELAEFEQLMRERDDAIFEAAGEIVPQFLSFVWFVSAALETANQQVTPDAVRQALTRTLAWRQMEEPERTRWITVAHAAAARYSEVAPVSRRRWASVGAGLGTARRLDRVAGELLQEIPERAVLPDPLASLELIFSGGRLQELLELAEAPKRRFYTRRAAGRVEVDIAIPQFLRDWIEGFELTVLADRHLMVVADADYRYEQLGDLINEYCEMFFPWVLGTIIQWVNRMREESGQPAPLPKQLAAYVRYGVSSPLALQLAISGVRSRRLCTAVAAEWTREATRPADLTVSGWIGSMTVAQWRQRFGASAAELRTLREYARPQASGVAEALLAGEPATVSLKRRVAVHPTAPATFRSVGEDVVEVDVVCGDVVVGTIPAQLWPDVQVLLESGVNFQAEAEVTEEAAELRLQPEQPADEGDF